MSEFVEDLKASLAAGLARELRQFGITPETAGMVAALVVDKEVVPRWRGCEPYIGAGNPNAARNRSIIREWRNGESVPLIARRYSLSRVRIWQIIKG